MATTLVTSPVFPVEGNTITLSVTGSTNDTFVFEITSVPSTSALATGFIADQDGLDNTIITQSNAQSLVDQDLIGTSFVGDVGGQYGISVWEFREAVGFTQGHDADRNSDARFDLQATTTFTIDVGVNMDLPIVDRNGDGATLRLNVASTTVRVASLITSTTEKGRVATLQTAVIAAVAALVSVSTTTLGTDIVAAINDFRSRFQDHLKQIAAPAAHRVVDATNVTLINPAVDISSAVTMVNDLSEKYVAHCITSSAEVLAFEWHENDVARGGFDDLVNLPHAREAVTLADATVLLADLRDKYTLHLSAAVSPLVEPQVHTEQDTANVLIVATSLLDTAIVTYLAALDDQSPAVPAGEPAGAQALTHNLGFIREST